MASWAGLQACRMDMGFNTTVRDLRDREEANLRDHEVTQASGGDGETRRKVEDPDEGTNKVGVLPFVPLMASSFDVSSQSE